MAHAIEHFARSVARVPRGVWFLVIPIILVLQASVLLALGRVPICTCGTVKLWHGIVHSAENSQHIFDWYSFTHILHGFWLYLFIWLAIPRAPFATRLVLAVFVEGTWEIIENTNFVIERYRNQTISLNYYGDSVVNSISDNISMMAGFLAARLLPIWSIVALGLLIEGALVYLIRDNLLLNAVMLIYPNGALQAWQAAAPLP